jgi:hypothetical protein
VTQLFRRLALSLAPLAIAIALTVAPAAAGVSGPAF